MNNNYFKFQEDSNFIIFGGGELIIFICDFFLKLKKKVIVISSKRQINQKILKNITLKNALKKRKIKFLILKDLRNYSKWSDLVNKNTIGISHSCEWIFKTREINLFKGKLINIHYSNLPSFRGGGGITWNILSQKFKSGITIHFINKQIDNGYYILMKNFSFPKNLRNSLAQMQKFSLNFQKKNIYDFLMKVIKAEKFKIKKIGNFKNSFYWPRLNTKKNAWINWNWEAIEIVDFINAFSKPHEGAKTYLNKKKIYLYEARKDPSKIKFHPFQYGLIYKIRDNEVFVAAKRFSVIVNVHHLKNKNKILGKRFYTRYVDLENSIRNVKI